MVNIIEALDQNNMTKLTEGKQMDAFAPGDTVRVNVRIIEGNTERVQAFEGICIAKKNRGLQSSFTIRKLSHGEGVERVFPLYSPRIESIVRVRQGDVRRAKLYYLRGLTGKAARIREKQDWLREAGKADKSEDKKSAATTEASTKEAAPKKTAAKAKPATKKSAQKKDES